MVAIETLQLLGELYSWDQNLGPPFASDSKTFIIGDKRTECEALCPRQVPFQFPRRLATSVLALRSWNKWIYHTFQFDEVYSISSLSQEKKFTLFKFLEHYKKEDTKALQHLRRLNAILIRVAMFNKNWLYGDVRLNVSFDAWIQFLTVTHFQQNWSRTTYTVRLPNGQVYQRTINNWIIMRLRNWLYKF